MVARYFTNVGSTRQNAPKRSGYRPKQRNPAEFAGDLVVINEITIL